MVFRRRREGTGTRRQGKAKDIYELVRNSALRRSLQGFLLITLDATISLTTCLDEWRGSRGIYMSPVFG